MDFFSKTDKGRLRKMNQDNAFASSKPLGSLPNLFILADGMGGHKAGDFASRYLIENMRDKLSVASNKPCIRLLYDSIVEINNELLKLSFENENLKGMGSTLVGAVIDGRTLNVVNIGDSRAYLIRRSSIRQISKDHSYVEEMVARGLMNRGSAIYNAQKNKITRVVGFDRKVNPDFFELELVQNDYVLLCTDGLCNMLSDDEILKIIRGKGSMEERVDSLIDAANLAGGKDNIGVILIDPFGKESV